MGPTVVRSSLEIMLDSLRQRDEKPKDSIPALPARPTSRGRLPSSRRPVNFNIGSNGLIGPEVTLKGSERREEEEGISGSKKIEKLEQPEESPYVKMPELESCDEERSEKVEGLDPIDSSGKLGCGATIDSVLKKDTNKEQPHVQPAVLEELQRRVLKAEAALRQKEEENFTLKQQLQQYETRLSDYEAKMKSMEEMWQKQMASLQMSLAAAKKSLAADDTPSLPGGLNASPNNHYFYSEDITMSTEFRTPEGTPAKQPRGSGAGLPRNSDGARNAVSHMVKEFEQQRQVFEGDAKFLIEVKSGLSLSSMNPDEELQKLKTRFVAWKKDYKAKLRETKVALRKLGNSETVKPRRKWWGMRRKK